MKLSKRLETVASFVPEGSNIADIGTDHGYVPICLVREGRAKRAVAMDVRKGPLERARAHVEEAGLGGQIDVRLSDGLKKLEPKEADCVVIAGMGGELIIHILEEGRRLWETIGYWVLSPQSELDKVRRFLEKESFSIERETMIKEDGKYYTVMGVTRNAVPQDKDGETEVKSQKEAYYRYGSRLIRQKNPVLKEFLEKEREQLEQIMETLKGSDTPAAVRRYEEMKELLAWNKEAEDEMFGTDTKA